MWITNSRKYYQGCKNLTGQQEHCGQTLQASQKSQGHTATSKETKAYADCHPVTLWTASWNHPDIKNIYFFYDWYNT